ncbi:MAG: FtsX-like permease family protein, partial [Acidobacteria bacterium]|nr:FtsX-like permease family protein [Acidobacteriota bacterium]
GTFFGAGASLLTAGLAAFAHLSRQARGARLRSGRGALASMALRNTARNPGRSILSVTLVAAATFVIVAAGVQRRPEGGESESPAGTGGYRLLAHGEVPLFEDILSREGQLDLGLKPETAQLLAGSQVLGLVELPGDDASCLNLFRVERPRVLGVPPEFVARGGFEFHASAAEVDNPWQLLEQPLPANDRGEAVVPAVADYETATWILKKGLGDDLDYEDEGGRVVHLRLVALLQSSIFQSDLLVAEEALKSHFPSVAGRSELLLALPPGVDPEVLASALERDLADFGFDVTTTAARLSGFKAVQNTYLSTFQTLGGLGLLLGTLGLAVVLLRNVLERRGELAVLRAFGFRRRRLVRWVLLENVFLLTLGLALGSLSAGVASWPYLSAAGSQIPWSGLALTLGAVFVAGTLACAAAAHRALAVHLIPALKGL